jgi:DNA invertase Pin-like site-specific DNA recombinase
MVDSININSISIYSPTIIYSRSSTKRQNNYNLNSASINTQSHSCMEFCKKNGLDIKFMRSEICSARNFNNQKKLNEIIESFNNINLVIFDVSRFSRNIADGVNMINKCFEKNITVYFVKDNLVIKSKQDLPKFTTQLINAHVESDTISYRLNESIKYRRSLGNYIGNAKYGYSKVKENNINKLVINEQEQLIIKIILKLKFGGLLSDLDKLTKELNKKIFKNIDRTDEIIMYGHYRNSGIAHILNYNGIKYKDNDWTPSNISNIINQNSEEQDRIEKELDEVFYDFSKLLSNSIKTKKAKNELLQQIINKINKINGYKTNRNIKIYPEDINSIEAVANVLDFYRVNFRLWSYGDIAHYLNDYIELNKKRKSNEISI